MSDTFAQRASGVLVPRATLDKTQYTLPNEDFQKLTRLLKFALEYELLARFYCARCKAPVVLRRRDQIVTELETPDGAKEDAGGGNLSLSCDCSTWTVAPPHGTTWKVR